jgi:glycerophosphoryl diester phosphodiesterase
MASASFAQLLSLDRYAIPLDAKGATIGKFVATGNETVKLLKDEAGIFTIADNTLSLKKNAAVKAGAPMSYVITVQCGAEVKRFELVKDEFLRNKVIAHRGAWKHHNVSQNTIGSLMAAIAIGCEGSEFDVWLTKDGRVALNHDNDLSGMIVEKSNLSALQTVELKAGEHIPTLEDYLALIKTQNKTRLVLELKSNGNPRALELADSAVRIVHRMRAQAWVDYISFDYKALLKVRSLDPTAAIANLSDKEPMDLLKIENFTGIDYNQGVFDNGLRVYERARMLGLTVNVWTVNDEAAQQRFLSMGVDFITTDEPEQLLRMVEKK